MREIVFLQQNAEKWQRFEAILDKTRKADPDELTELFVDVTDDLSYARTFYPESKTVAYLNELAQRIHTRVYRSRREPGGRLIRFWRSELPAILYAARKELLVSFAVFAAAAALGWISTTHDAGFARLILGDAYVNMTLSNIETNDPMAVYKQANEMSMFLGITVNNVRVAILAFAAGLLLSLGTVFVLFQNGVMIGTFFTLFYQQGQLGAAMRTVWIHGTLEISAIVIAGAAGLVIGNSILFPGTYKRLASFRRGARAGMKILVGTIPLFIVAGVLEGFVTRHTEMPLAATVLVIGASLVFVVTYFILYPTTKKQDVPGAIND